MSKRRPNFGTKCFKEISLFIFHARIALKSLILLFVRLIARGGRYEWTHTHIYTHIHTHIHTHRTTTVTLAAHARRGLTSTVTLVNARRGLTSTVTLAHARRGLTSTVTLAHARRGLMRSTKVQTLNLTEMLQVLGEQTGMKLSCIKPQSKVSGISIEPRSSTGCID